VIVRLGSVVFGGVAVRVPVPVVGQHRGLLVHCRGLPVRPTGVAMPRGGRSMRIERALTRLVGPLAGKVGGL